MSLIRKFWGYEEGREGESEKEERGVDEKRPRKGEKREDERKRWREVLRL